MWLNCFDILVNRFWRIGGPFDRLPENTLELRRIFQDLLCERYPVRTVSSTTENPHTE